MTKKPLSSASRFCLLHQNIRRRPTTPARLLLCLLLGLYTPLTTAQPGNPQTPVPAKVELFHWWISDGESTALDVIRDEIRARGGSYTEQPFANAAQLRQHILKRLRHGYQPALTQWLGGKDFAELVKLNATSTVPESWHDQPLAELLFPEVIAEIQKGQTIAAIPVVNHLQNVAFFNAEIYRQLGLELPTDWAGLLEQAAQIKQAGHTPLAMSREPWQMRMLFNTLLLEHLKGNGFRRFFSPQTHDLSPFRAELITSFRQFLSLKDYVAPGDASIPWHQAVKQLHDGKAAILVLGDFATGELHKLDALAGEDFTCTVMPERSASILYAVDSFVPLHTTDPALIAGQKLMFEVVLDPEVQARFTAVKGGIPVRRDVDIRLLDICTQKRYQHWLQAEVIKLQPADSANPARQTLLEKTLELLWSEDMPVEQAADQLIIWAKSTPTTP